MGIEGVQLRLVWLFGFVELDLSVFFRHSRWLRAYSQDQNPLPFNSYRKCFKFQEYGCLVSSSSIILHRTVPSCPMAILLMVLAGQLQILRRLGLFCCSRYLGASVNTILPQISMRSVSSPTVTQYPQPILAKSWRAESVQNATISSYPSSKPSPSALRWSCYYFKLLEGCRKSMCNTAVSLQQPCAQRPNSARVGMNWPVSAARWGRVAYRASCPWANRVSRRYSQLVARLRKVFSPGCVLMSKSERESWWMRATEVDYCPIFKYIVIIIVMDRDGRIRIILCRRTRSMILSRRSLQRRG